MIARFLPRGIASLLLAALAVSCSSSSAPQSPAPVIPTGGENKSLNALVGHWEGTHTNPGNGRTGTIVLDVTSGGKEARGDILMVPPGANARATSVEESLRTMPQIYEINFIQAEGNMLNGTVGPYEDPASHCKATSVFQGSLQGDSIVGTFRTECLDPQGKPDPSVPATTGTWTISRKKI